MKKFYLMLAVVLLSLLSANAQTNQVVWVNGRAVMGQAISQVDSIKYGSMEEADRLYLTLPRKVVIRDTIIETTVVRDTFHIPADAIAGVFSVSEDKKVCFAKGNLQYTQSTKTWSFAEHQYDIIGDANLTTDGDGNTLLADKIDLFGWSGNTAPIQWGLAHQALLQTIRANLWIGGLMPLVQMLLTLGILYLVTNGHTSFTLVAMLQNYLVMLL